MSKRASPRKAERQPWLRLDVYLASENSMAELGPLEQVGRLSDSPNRELGRDDLAAIAGNIYQARRARARFFSPSLFGEPVWDMLLALYFFSARGESLSVSSLCYSADVPQTTALRWVQLMEQKKLISRRRDRNDGRRTFVILTDEAKSLVEEYLATIHGSLAA